jgi:hypothetical protein
MSNYHVNVNIAKSPFVITTTKMLQCIIGQLSFNNTLHKLFWNIALG